MNSCVDTNKFAQNVCRSQVNTVKSLKAIPNNNNIVVLSGDEDSSSVVIMDKTIDIRKKLVWKRTIAYCFNSFILLGLRPPILHRHFRNGCREL